MNDKDAKYDLMYAYALGCLNEDEVLNFQRNNSKRRKLCYGMN